MQHVLISANKGVVSLFSLSLLSLSAPGGERCWLFALLLSLASRMAFWET